MKIKKFSIPPEIMYLQFKKEKKLTDILYEPSSGLFEDSTRLDPSKIF